MADTFTEFLNLTRPEIGASRDAWGEKLNANMTKIDTWVKASDAINKNSVQKVGDAGQTINSALDVKGPLGALAGISAPVNQKVSFGYTSMVHALGANVDATFLQLGGNTLFITDTSNTFHLLSLNPDTFLFRGKRVWHEGILNSAIFADKSVSTVQRFKAPIELNFDSTYMDFVYPDRIRLRQSVDGNGTYIISNGDTSENRFTVDGFGQVWTRQLGDLSTHINNKANTANQNAVDQARGFANNALANSKDYTDSAFGFFRGNTQIFTADQQITKDYPSWRLLYPGKRDYSLQVRENGGFYIWDNTANRMALYVGPDGSLATSQFGDVNSRIEKRAADFADDRLNAAKTYTNNNFIPRYIAGQRVEITSYLSAAGEFPFFELVWGGKIRWQMRIADNNELQFFNPDTGAVIHAFRPDGSQWNSQFGDLNNRIEQRARDYADARNMRFVFAGDVGTDWRPGEGYNDPFAGGVCTGVRHANSAVTGMRWRYLQQQSTNGQWYTVPYA